MERSTSFVIPASLIDVPVGLGGKRTNPGQVHGQFLNPSLAHGDPVGLLVKGPSRVEPPPQA